MPAGRPTKYSKALLAKAQDYLENYQLTGDAVPQIAGLAIVLGITRTTIYDWAGQESKPEFSDIVKQVLVAQERALMNGGLKGEFNSAITKLALSKHGYAEKHESDITSGGKPIQNEWHLHPVTTDKNGSD